MTNRGVISDQGGADLGTASSARDDAAVEPAGGRVSPPAKGHLDERTFLELKGFSALGLLSAERAAKIPHPPAKGRLSETTAPLAPSLVNCRVDALVLAYKVEVSRGFSDELEERQAIADSEGVAEQRIAGLSFSMKRSRRIDAAAFENADVRAVYDRRGSGGWVLEVVVRAMYLATHRLSEAEELGRRIANGLGDVTHERLRRVDLAADYSGFPLEAVDGERLLTTRAKVTSFLVDAKDVGEAGGELCHSSLGMHRNSALRVTGMSIAAGNPLMARLYDKSTELACPGREDKREIEHELWRLGGWDGELSMTRVEFQLRSEVLHEMGLRDDPGELEDHLDAIWQRCVLWLRIIEPDTATRRKRCKLDPRWEAVTETIFVHPAEPIERKRRRGGAKPEHVLGTMRSRQASTGQLGHIELNTADGEVLDEKSYVERLSIEEARVELVEHVEDMYAKSANDTLQSLIQKRGEKDAWRHAIAQNNASVARFSSVDDEADD